VLRSRAESDVCTKQSCHVAAVPNAREAVFAFSMTTYKPKTVIRENRERESNTEKSHKEKKRKDNI
jgi:hypothetical protein